MLWFWIAFIIYIILPFIAAVDQYKRPAAAAAWVLVILALPYIGFVMYLILSSVYRRSEKRRIHRTNHAERGNTPAEIPIAGLDDRLVRLLNRMHGSAYAFADRVVVYNDGIALFNAMLQAINHAKEEVNFQFYILRNDRTGNMFVQALQHKARQGVKVRVLLDGAGSNGFPSESVDMLKKSGAEVYFFLPIARSLWNRRLNYRNHRKNVVVDGKIAFFGGFNVGDEYVGKDPKLGYWRDTHITVEGEAAAVLRRQFLNDWEAASGQVLDLLMPESHEEKDGQEKERGSLIQLIASGPDEITDSIYEAYYGAIASAKKSVYIETPYLTPDTGLFNALKIAARSGVDVRIIIPGVSEHPVVHWATLSFAEDLVRAGVKVYRYRTGFIHAKVMLVDGAIAFAGSVNIDVRSFFTNFELSAVFFDGPVIESLLSDFMKDQENSEEVKPADFQGRTVLQSAKERIARLLSPLF